MRIPTRWNASPGRKAGNQNNPGLPAILFGQELPSPAPGAAARPARHRMLTNRKPPRAASPIMRSGGFHAYPLDFILHPCQTVAFSRVDGQQPLLDGKHGLVD